MDAALAAIVARIDAAFRRRFGRAPRVFAAAPGRVNLIGDHVDYEEGIVLPCAIDRWIVAALAPGATPRHRVAAIDRDGDCAIALHPTSASSLPADAPDWVAYPAGALAALGDRVDPDRPIDVAFGGTVPPGGGLASSAAVAVAIALARLELDGARVAVPELARRLQRAEHDFAGTPCGLMDPYVCAGARADAALAIDCRDGTAEVVPIPPHAALLVIDSGVRHALAEGAYAARRAACRRAAAAIGIRTLREASEDAIDATSLDAADRACARHVVREIRRVREAIDRMRAGDLAGVGDLMRASHASLRDDFAVSTPELDAIASALEPVPGVHGARMTGGGFGGSVVALLDSDARDAALASLPHPEAAQSVRPVPGAGSWAAGQ